MRKPLLPLLLTIVVVLTFAACHRGGGDETPASTPTNPDTTTNPGTTNPTNPSNPAAPVQVLTGVFIDAPVEGLTFVSGSQTGTTDPAGAFKYEAGGTVQFKLGNVVLGQAPGKALMTPVDLVKVFDPAADAASPRVIQIVQFLMTVDANSNVVSAPTMSMSSFAAANAATVSPVDLSTTVMDQAALATLLATVVPTKTLVLPAVATAHLQAVLDAIAAPKTGGVFAALDSVTNPTMGLRLSITSNGVGNGFDVGGVAASIDGSTWNIGGTMSLNGSIQATGGGNGTPAPPDMTITGSVLSATQLTVSISFANTLPPKTLVFEKAVAPAVAAQGKFGLPDAGVPPAAGDLVHVIADMNVKADGTITAHVVRGQVTGVVALAAIYSSHFAGLSGIVTSTGNIIAMGGTPGNGEALNLNGKTLTNVSPVTFMTGTAASITMTAMDLNLAGPASTTLNFVTTTDPLVGVYQGTHSDTAPGLPSTFTFAVDTNDKVHGFTMFLRQRPAGIQQSPFLLDGDVSIAGVLGLGGAPLPATGLPGLVLTDQEGVTNLTPGTFDGTINSATGVASGGWQTGPGVPLTGTFTGNILP